MQRMALEFAFLPEAQPIDQVAPNMSKKIPTHLIALCEEIMAKESPVMLLALPKVRTNEPSNQECLTLIDAISDEFCSTGLKPDGEPNERGLLLESLLDHLNCVTNKSGDQ